MEALSGAQRTYLRGLAHNLQPLVQIGKKGLTFGVLQEIKNSLDAHELIKVKFNDFKGEKASITTQIAQESESEFLGTVGNIAMFYRQHPDPDKRKIILP